MAWLNLWLSQGGCVMSSMYTATKSGTAELTVQPNSDKQHVSDIVPSQSSTATNSLSSRLEVKNERSCCPSRADWKTYRPLITKLYWQQGKLLREVTRFMEDHHNFRASENMYKKRIKMWGLDKKFKRNEAVAMLALINHYRSAGSDLMLVLRGRVIEQSDLRRYARRARVTDYELFSVRPSDALKMPGLSCHSGSNVGRNVKAPDHHHQIEWLHHEIRSYLHGAVESGFCRVSKISGVEWEQSVCHTPDNMWSLLDYGNLKFTAGQTQAAFLAWRKAFLESGSLLTSHDPQDWLVYMDMQLTLKTIGASDVGVSLNQHLLSLVDLQTGSNHPTHRILKVLFGLDTPSIIASFSSCASLIRDTWEQYMEALSLLLTICRINAILRVHQFAPTDLNVLDKHIIHLRSHNPQNDNVLYLASLYRYKHYLLHDQKKWAEARETRKEAMGYLAESLSHESRDHEMLLAHFHIACMSFKIEQYSRAKSEFVEFLQYHTQFEETYDYGFCDEDLHSCYSHMHHISTQTDIADGDLQWQMKMKLIEQRWDEELATAVGDLNVVS